MLDLVAQVDEVSVSKGAVTGADLVTLAETVDSSLDEGDGGKAEFDVAVGCLGLILHLQHPMSK